MGAQLRMNGAPWELAADHADWIRVTLAHATVYTVLVPTGELLVLTSDGVHDQVPDAMEELARGLHDDPQALADGLVAASAPDADGYRDDATALVLTVGP